MSTIMQDAEALVIRNTLRIYIALWLAEAWGTGERRRARDRAHLYLVWARRRIAGSY